MAGVTLEDITLGAGTDALDTYDLGTFTPVLTFGGGSAGITYSTQLGRYVKIGRLVFWSFRISLTNKGSSTGSAVITGLPFTVANDLGATGIGGLRFSNLTFSGHPSIGALPNTTTLSFQMAASGGAAADIVDTGFANTTTIQASGCYEAAS